MHILQGIKHLLKRYFVAGLIVTVPLIGTYLILKLIITSADDLVISMIPERFSPEEIFGQDIPGLGLIVTIILIFLVGMITRLYIGKKLIRLGDWVISKIPLGRGIYNGIKQFMTTVLSYDHSKFKSVVAVEYPRKDCWIIGFLTSDSISEVQGLSGDTMVNIFIPTTPNPTSGFLIMVPKHDIHPIAIGVDQAFKLIISGGIVRKPTDIPLDSATNSKS